MQACAAVPMCRFFRYGYGPGKHKGRCKQEFTSSPNCPEGFSNSPYDFYALEPFGQIGVFMELWTGMHWRRLGDFDALGPAEATAWLAGVNYRAGFQPVLGGKIYRDLFAARFTGQFRSPSTGLSIFATCSDDGSKFFVNGRGTWYVVVNNDGLHGTKCAAGVMFTDAHKAYSFEAQFWENWGHASMELSWKPWGHPWQLLRAERIGPSPPPAPPPSPSPSPPPPPPLPVWWPKNDVEKMMVDTTVVQDISTRLTVKMERLVDQMKQAMPTDGQKFTESASGSAAALLELSSSLPEHLRGIELQTQALSLPDEPAARPRDQWKPGEDSSLFECARDEVGSLLMSGDAVERLQVMKGEQPPPLQQTQRDFDAAVDVTTHSSLLEVGGISKTPPNNAVIPEGMERFAVEEPQHGGGAASIIAGDRCGPEGKKCKDDLKELWPHERIQDVEGPRTLANCDAGEACGVCFMAIPKDKCKTVDLPPSFSGYRYDIRRCTSAVEPGGYCEGDGECGTNQHHNQCGPGGWDIYEHRPFAPRDDQVQEITLRLKNTLLEASRSLQLAREARGLAEKITDGAEANAFSLSDYDVAFTGDAMSAVEILHLPPMTSFSVSMWVKSLNPMRSGAIFSLGNDEMPAFLGVSNPNGLFVEVNGRRQRGPDRLVLPENEWHHVAFTWRSKAGYWALYVDGVQVSLGVALAGQQTPHSSRLTLGQRVDRTNNGFTPGFAFQGEMSQVNLFKEELAPSQIPMTLRFVPNTIPSLFKWWSMFRKGQVGAGVSEIHPSTALREAPQPCGPEANEACPTNNFDARFKENDAGALHTLGYQAMREFTVCAWLRCDPHTHQNGRVALTYATVAADNTLVVNSDYTFMLHGKRHPLRDAPNCAFWRHFCLTYERGGNYHATIDGKRYVEAHDDRNRGLPPGGAMIVGQYQRRLGVPYSPERKYVGDVHAVGVWNVALNEAALEQARSTMTHGALKEWRMFRAGRSGTVYWLEPTSVLQPAAAPSPFARPQHLSWGFDSKSENAWAPSRRLRRQA